jgi:hypothetical protein
MQCVEFESRLNGLLDERLSPAVDDRLVEHAQRCTGCSELLAVHELLLEGIQELPTVRLCDADLRVFAHRVVAEVGSLPAERFPTATQVELLECDSPVVAKSVVAPWTIVGIVLATAAALLIALMLRSPTQPRPGAPDVDSNLFVGPPDRTLPKTNHEGPITDYGDLALIARVGYQVADRLTPVTNSMVSAYRELRKRPFFRNSDEPQRSSFYAPHGVDEVLA